MTHNVKINNDLNIPAYSLDNPNADLTINGTLKCTNYIYIHANKITLNANIAGQNVSIFAKSIIINGQIQAREQIRLEATYFLRLKEKITCEKHFFLSGKIIIIINDVHSKESTITAEKVALVGKIISPLDFDIDIKDYIIKVGSLPLVRNGFEYYPPEKEIKNIEEIKKALVDDFNIQEPELSQILDKYRS